MLYNFSRSLLFFAKGEGLLRHSHDIDLLTDYYVSFAEAIHTPRSERLLFQLVENSSDKELSKEDRANVLDILWGTGEIVGGIFISVGGHPKAGASLVFKGLYDVGRGLMSVIETNKKEGENDN